MNTIKEMQNNREEDRKGATNSRPLMKISSINEQAEKNTNG
jgi:hypothetical protein